jgi:excisionase family DNA binding protein
MAPERSSSDAPQEAWLTITEAASQAGLSRVIVMHWVRNGKLASSRRGRRHLVRPSDLAAVQTAAHAGHVVPVWRTAPVRFGRRLRLLREAEGRSQLALAAATGLSHEALSNLERGKRAPSADTVHRLAQALGIAPERFVDEGPIGLTMLSVAEAAFRLDVPADRVQKWVRQGELPGSKVSGQWRVPEIAVAALGRSGRLRGASRRLDPRYRG